MDQTEKIHDSVKDYYTQLNSSKDLKTSACTIAPSKIESYKPHLKNIPAEIINKFYGCGMPIPFGIKNLTILDLGCGTGRDCYISSSLVGEEGKVIGVDMLDAQLDVAKKYVDEFTTNLGYKKPNLHFYKGYIEDLSSIQELAPNSVDIVISNCVVNLSPRKDLVMKEVFRVLKPGGEMYFSDVYSDRRITKEALENELLFGECISGALYINDFITLCKKTGFHDPRELEKRQIDIYSRSSEMRLLRKLLGDTKFYSITYRLFKLELEPNCEDYGQYAIYKGTIESTEWAYLLDNHHKFEKNKPKLICGNTADMLSKTWLKNHFDVFGEKIVHFGVFPCDNTIEEEKAPMKGGCC